jgi:sulfite exporter TauE/SafE
MLQPSIWPEARDENMHEVIIEPLLAGLSMGLFCCVSCYPFLAPIFVAEDRGAGATLRIWLQFILGRLVGYVLFGAAIGWLGERFEGAGLTRVSSLGMMAMALWLVFYAVGFWRPAWSFCPAGTRRGAATPVLLGFLMGVNACPPFLMSAAYVLTLHSMAKGIVYFLVFFCVTTLYLVPLFFVGLLGRIKEFRWAARASAFLVGVLFLIYGTMTLLR